MAGKSAAELKKPANIHIKVVAQHDLSTKMDGATGRMLTLVRSSISEIGQVASSRGRSTWHDVKCKGWLVISLSLHKAFSAKPILGSIILPTTCQNSYQHMQESSQLGMLYRIFYLTWYTTVYSLMWNDCFRIPEISNINKLSTLCQAKMTFNI